MRAITQTLLATARDFALQSNAQAHAAKMAKAAVRNPWLSPSVVVPVVVAAIAVTPKAYSFICKKLEERKQDRLGSYVERRMAELSR